MSTDNYFMETYGDLINKWCETLGVGDDPRVVAETADRVHDLISRSGNHPKTEYELSARMVDLGFATPADSHITNIFNKKSVHGSFPQFMVDTRNRSSYTREGILVAEGRASLSSLLQCKVTNKTLDEFCDDYVRLLITNRCIILDGSPTEIYHMRSRNIMLLDNAQRADAFIMERDNNKYTESEIVYMAVRDEMAAYYPAYYNTTEYGGIRMKLDNIKYRCGIYDIVSDKHTDLDGGVLTTHKNQLRKCLGELIEISNELHALTIRTESVEFNASIMFKVPNIGMGAAEVVSLGSFIFYLSNTDRIVAPALVLEKKPARKEEPTAFGFVKCVCKCRRDFYDFLAHATPVPMVATL